MLLFIRSNCATSLENIIIVMNAKSFVKIHIIFGHFACFLEGRETNHGRALAARYLTPAGSAGLLPAKTPSMIPELLLVLLREVVFSI